jgi:hypothetical protein
MPYKYRRHRTDAEMTPRSLTELANEHGSDKGTVGPSAEWGAHNYTDVYEAYLEPLRSLPISLLEIGLGVTGERWQSRIVHGRNTGGASLKMWRDYFPQARIHGIDVNDCSFLDDERVSTFVADQGNVDDLRAFTEATGGTAFDVIVDDGSHRPDHQQLSLGYFFDWLKPGGLYFVEDLQANGYGDAARGRQAANDVRNTRAVLRHLRAHGEAPEPHGLPDPGALARQLEHIGLHVPRMTPVEPPRTRLWRRRRSTRRRGRWATAFEPESERLAVLRKRRR